MILLLLYLYNNDYPRLPELDEPLVPELSDLEELLVGALIWLEEERGADCTLGAGLLLGVLI